VNLSRFFHSSDGRRGRRPRMTLAGSVQVLVLYIFVCVPRSLPAPVTSTSVSVRLNSLRLAGRPVRMSLRKFHLECLQSVVYLCRTEATVHHLIPKGDFSRIRSGAPGKKPEVIAGTSSRICCDRYAVTNTRAFRSLRSGTQAAVPLTC
jgi:hypothetical protein